MLNQGCLLPLCRCRPQVEERSLQALTFVSHRYGYWSHNFLALLFGERAVPQYHQQYHHRATRAALPSCRPLRLPQLPRRLLPVRSHAPPWYPCTRAAVPPAVAEEWRNEPRAMEGQELVWVHCEELLSYAPK